MEEGIRMETNSPQNEEVIEATVYFSQKTLIDNYWIKKKTEMVHLRKEITASEYDEKFKEQKALLEKSIKLVRDISVQVFESKKYHNDFLTEAGF